MINDRLRNIYENLWQLVLDIPEKEHESALKILDDFRGLLNRLDNGSNKCTMKSENSNKEINNNKGLYIC